MPCLKIFNFESTKVARCLDGLCQKNRNERREKESENDKTVELVEEVTPQILFLDTKPLLFLRMSYFKWMHISKTWLSRFFLELNNNHLYSFWTEIIDLLLLKCEQTRCFFTPPA